MRTLLFLAVVGVLLALSNPTMDDFAAFAGDVVAEEIQREDAASWVGTLGGLAAEALVERAAERDNYVVASRYTVPLGGDADEAWVFVGVATRFVEVQRPASLREE